MITVVKHEKYKLNYCDSLTTVLNSKDISFYDTNYKSLYIN